MDQSCDEMSSCTYETCSLDQGFGQDVLPFESCECSENISFPSHASPKLLRVHILCVTSPLLYIKKLQHCKRIENPKTQGGTVHITLLRFRVENHAPSDVTYTILIIAKRLLKSFERFWRGAFWWRLCGKRLRQTQNLVEGTRTKGVKLVSAFCYWTQEKFKHIRHYSNISNVSTVIQAGTHMLFRTDNNCQNTFWLSEFFFNFS